MPDCFRSSALSVSPTLNVIFARSQLSLPLEHPPRFNPPRIFEGANSVSPPAANPSNDSYASSPQVRYLRG